MSWTITPYTGAVVAKQYDRNLNFDIAACRPPLAKKVTTKFSNNKNSPQTPHGPVLPAQIDLSSLARFVKAQGSKPVADNNSIADNWCRKIIRQTPPRW